MEKKRCTFCVMDNESDQTIIFDETGRCNYCREAEKRKKEEYFPTKEGEEILKNMMNKIKLETKEDEYNCLVGVSGGIDSSYVLYLGYKYGLKMLALHIDDGLDTEISKRNIEKLCKATKTKLINIKPDKKEYADLILSFFKAGLPEVAIPQDNILFCALMDIQRKNKIKYFLSGLNFSMESILERGEKVNAHDKVHILNVHKLYGKIKIKNLKFSSIIKNYIFKKYLYKLNIIKPLNYIDYNLETSLSELKNFCDFEYYGGKHHENILTRFIQCYYLPIKFNKDKRKSHLSSMIISNQITREEALEILKKDAYESEEILKRDKEVLAEYFNIPLKEFEEILKTPPKKHLDYKCSYLNKFANLGRKYRKFLGY